MDRTPEEHYSVTDGGNSIINNNHMNRIELSKLITKKFKSRRAFCQISKKYEPWEIGKLLNNPNASQEELDRLKKTVDNTKVEWCHGDWGHAMAKRLDQALNELKKEGVKANEFCKKHGLDECKVSHLRTNKTKYLNKTGKKVIDILGLEYGA